MNWPPINEALLLERLAMDDDAFGEYMTAMAQALGPRSLDDALHARALSYPWGRPEGSFLLRGDVATPLAMLTEAEADAVIARLTGSERYPVLAYGSNAAPGALAAKLAHFEDEGDREVLALAGTLHGFDVGVAAHPTAYGAMPATLFPSPDTRLRVAVLWVNATQFVQLAWSELSYRLGSLSPVTLVPDDPGAPSTATVLAFVSRLGAFAPDGQPVALAAIEAQGRTAPALTQEGVLDRAASLALNPQARARDLIEAVFTDFAAFAEGGGNTVRAAGQPFASPAWTPYPTL